MSIPFSGSLSRSGGLSAAIKKQVRLSNLKAAKSVTVKFDPWNQESSALSARKFLFHIGTKEALSRNPDCKLSTVIVNDRSEPVVTCELVNGEKVVIKTRNFTAVEVLQLFNKYVSPHAPETVEVVQTKASKSRSHKRK